MPPTFETDRSRSDLHSSAVSKSEASDSLAVSSDKPRPKRRPPAAPGLPPCAAGSAFFTGDVVASDVCTTVCVATEVAIGTH